MVAPDLLTGPDRAIPGDRLLFESWSELAGCLAGWRAVLDGESLSAFCHSALDGVSAIWRAHPSEEPVSPLSLALVGLIGSFHGWSFRPIKEEAHAPFASSKARGV